MDDIATALTNSLDRTGQGGMLAPLRFADGTETAPSISFLSETNTGVYRVGTGQMGWTIQGTQIVSMTGAGVSVTGDINVTGLVNGRNIAADGALLDTALQPGDNVSELVNDAGYLTAISGFPLEDLSDVTITAIAAGEILKWDGAAWINNTLVEAGIATAAQGALADTALQPGDNVSELVNDAGYLDPTTGVEPGDNATVLGSGATAADFVLTSDGAGNTAWTELVGGLQAQTISVNTAAVNGTHYYCDTDAITVTLPASPVANDQIAVSVGDFTGVNIARNGSNINGDASDFAMNVATSFVLLRYIDATEGWTVSGFAAEDSITSAGVSGTDSQTLRFNGTALEATSGLVVDGSGNVGIGTAPAVRKLEIESSQQVIAEFEGTNGSADSSFIDFKHTNSASEARIGILDDAIYFGNAPGTSERMRIDASGNVGIGATNPNTKLFVSETDTTGLIQLSLRNEGSAGTNKALLMGVAGSASIVPLWTDKGVVEGQDGLVLGAFAGDTIFQKGNSTRAEAMRIDASGNLLVGTTATVSSVAGAVIANNGYIQSTVSSTNNMYLNRLGSDGVQIQFANDNVTAGNIAVSGSTTNFNTSSDYRLKDNITDAPSGNINDLKVRSFDWKADGSHQRWGFVAQELEPHYPEAVSKGETEDDMWGVDYSKLVPMLVKEIQELKQEQLALQAEVEALKNA